MPPDEASAPAPPDELEMTAATAEPRRPGAENVRHQGRPPVLRSLNARLLLIVLVAVVPVFGAQVYYESALRTARRAEVGAQVEQTAVLVAAQLDRLIEGAEAVMVTLGQYPSVRRRDAAVCSETLVRLVARFPMFDGLGAATPDGEIFCSSRFDAVPFSVAERPYFQEALQKKSLVVSTIVLGQLTGRKLIALAQPAYDEAGELETVLVLSLDLDVISSLLSPAVPLPAGATIDVLAGDGRRILRVPYDPDLIGEPVAPPVPPAGPALSADQDGVTRFHGSARSGEAPDLLVSVGLPQEEVFEEADRLFVRQLVISALGFLATGVVAYRFGAYAIRRPIAHLQAAMQRAAAGDFSARADLDSGIPELSELARSFDDMARRRRHAEEQHDVLLRELNHRIRNKIATIRSIALQTLRHSDSLEAFEQAFEGRLAALVRTSTLIGGGMQQADLQALVAAAVEPYRTDRNIVLHGPPMALPSAAAIPISLVLHELATNAAKYGALSEPYGRVEITWSVTTGGARRPRLLIDWSESGGPAVAPPVRRGFGCALIERSVAHELEGEVQLEFLPDGARCRIALPLADGEGGAPA